MLCKQAIHRIIQCFGSRDIELSIRCKIQYIKTEDIDQATVAHVVPPPHCGEDALCLLQRDVHDADSIFFMFQQIKYSLRSDRNQFVELDFPTDLPIAHYIDDNTLTDDDAEGLKLKYGSNEFNIPRTCRCAILFVSNILCWAVVFGRILDVHVGHVRNDDV